MAVLTVFIDVTHQRVSPSYLLSSLCVQRAVPPLLGSWPGALVPGSAKVRLEGPLLQGWVWPPDPVFWGLHCAGPITYGSRA